MVRLLFNLRLACLVLILGMPGASYVLGACATGCKTTFCMITSASQCQMWYDPAAQLPVTNAYDLTVYAQVITEKLPANATGTTVDIYSPTCQYTCAKTELPQECTATFKQMNKGGSVNQRACTIGTKGSSTPP